MMAYRRWILAGLVLIGTLGLVAAAQLALAPHTGWLTFNVPPGPSEYAITLRRSGANIELLDSATHAVLQRRPLAETAGVTIQGAPGNAADTLTVDLSGGALALGNGIHFDGGAGGYNTLEVIGGEAAPGSYLATGPGSGVVTHAGTVIYFSNLQPVTDTSPAPNFTVTGTVSTHTINIVNGGSCGGVCQTTQVNSPSFESVSFANKTNVTVKGGAAANVINLNNSSPATGLSKLVLDGGGNPGDAITIVNFNLPGGTLELTNAITVGQSGVLAVANLAINVGGPVGLSNPSNVITTTAGATTGAGANFNLTSGVPTLTVGIVDGIAGITTANGPVSVENSKTGGALVVNNAIATAGGNFLAYADQMSLNATLNSGAGSVYLDNETSTEPIALGSKPANTLGLIQSDLNQITASRLQIGSFGTDTGGLTVTTIITSPAGWSTLDLRQHAIIDELFTAELSVPNLVLQAHGGDVNWGLTPNHVSILAGATTGGSFAFHDGGQTTIGAVGGVSGISTAGGTVSVGANKGGLTIHQDVHAGAGTISLVAEGSSSATDNLTVDPGVVVSSTAGDVFLDAGKHLNLGAGSVVAAGGAGTVAIAYGLEDFGGIDSAAIAGTISGHNPRLFGGSGDDSLFIDFANGASFPNELSYDGEFGQNSVTISDAGSGSPHLYSAAGPGMSRDSANLIHCTNVHIMTINAGSGADTFDVRPDAGVTFHINGGLPGSPPGDGLVLSLLGAVNPTLAITSFDATGAAGQWTFDNRQPVYFTGIDSFLNLFHRVYLPVAQE